MNKSLIDKIKEDFRLGYRERLRGLLTSTFIPLGAVDYSLKHNNEHMLLALGIEFYKASVLFDFAYAISQKYLTPLLNPM
jgi:hypothetical protein